MKIQHFWRLAITTAGLAAFAVAGPITVTFNGAAGGAGSISGTPSPSAQPYYPYSITITPGGTLTVACDDINAETPGTSYQADVEGFSTSNAGAVNGFLNLDPPGPPTALPSPGTPPKFGNQANALVEYQEAAYLFYQFEPSTGSNEHNAAINYAIWNLFSPPVSLAPANGDLDPKDGSSYWTTLAGANYLTLTASQISDFRIYTPDPIAPRTGSELQEMIGSSSPVPEPASLALLGTGLLGLAFLFKRRLHEGADLDSRA